MNAWVMGVSMTPGHTQFTRTFGAHVSAIVAGLPGRQTILVTGATGFIGSRLVSGLTDAGHHVIALVRDPAKADALHPPITLITKLDQVADDAKIDAIVNLAGEPIGNGLWTEAKRRKILDSRIGMTNDVVRLIGRLERRPGVLISVVTNQSTIVAGSSVCRWNKSVP